jgi:hypothetical protein
MTPRELRATLDCLDLSAAEAGHLRATVYRWLDGSTSVPIVVELLLRLMVRRGIRPTEVTASRHGRTSAKPRSGRSQAKSAKRIVHPNTRAKSKQDAVLALLSRPRGAAIAAMMQATGWQSHSVCGFLAGVVRKKLGLTLQSDKTEGERVYRVIRTGETALAYSPTVGAAHRAVILRNGKSSNLLTWAGRIRFPTRFSSSKLHRGAMSGPGILRGAIARKKIAHFLLDFVCKQSVSGGQRSRPAERLRFQGPQFLSPASAVVPPRGCGGGGARCAVTQRGAKTWRSVKLRRVRSRARQRRPDRG